MTSYRHSVPKFRNRSFRWQGELYQVYLDDENEFWELQQYQPSLDGSNVTERWLLMEPWLNPFCTELYESVRLWAESDYRDTISIRNFLHKLGVEDVH